MNKNIRREAKNTVFLRTQSHCVSTRIRELQNVPTTPLYELTYGMTQFNAVHLNGERRLPKATAFIWTKSTASSPLRKGLANRSEAS